MHAVRDHQRQTWKYALFGIAFLFSLQASDLLAHCQVPCGIYDDEGRIKRLQEDATTIAKAIKKMEELASKHDVESLNQFSRWVTTKEQHASHIITVVAEYFLTQKVKPVATGQEGHDHYLEVLAAHHAVMRAAMIAKQKPTGESVVALEKAIHEMAHHYE